VSLSPQGWKKHRAPEDRYNPIPIPNDGGGGGWGNTVSAKLFASCRSTGLTLCPAM